MSKIPFDPETSAINVVREAIFERLRNDSNWNQYDLRAEAFDGFVEFIGERHQTTRRFLFLASEVMWQLLIEGIIAPGSNPENTSLPFFHKTDFGERVINSQSPPIYDSAGYLDYISEKVSDADPTVLAYLQESLETFRKGNLIASVVMLGVSAEKVFLLLCESTKDALKDPVEQQELERILDRNSMLAKQEFLTNKFSKIRKKDHPEFPEGSSATVSAVYNLIRMQRNDYGHPQEAPPTVDREEVMMYLNVFHSYYRHAEELRAYLKKNQI